MQSVAAYAVAGGVDVGQGLFRGAQHGPSLGQGGGLSRARRQPIEFGETMGQHLALLPGGGLRRFQRFGLPARLAPRPPSSGACIDQRSAAAETVELRAMGSGVEKSDGLVLAVTFHQHGAQVAQHADAGRLVVDEGARPPVRRYGAPEHQVFARVAPQRLLG